MGAVLTKRAECPACRKAFPYPAERAGEIVNCPHCRNELTLPRPLEAQAVAAEISGLDPREFLTWRIRRLQQQQLVVFVAAILSAAIGGCIALIVGVEQGLRGAAEVGLGSVLTALALFGLATGLRIEIAVLENRMIAGDQQAGRR